MGMLNTTPATREQISEALGLPLESVDRFFEENFGSYQNYVEICKDPRGLELCLRRMWEEGVADYE